jgi:hypothetical protein
MHCVEVPEESNHLVCGTVSWTALKVRSLEQEQWRRQRGFSILYTQILKWKITLTISVLQNNSIVKQPRL